MRKIVLLAIALVSSLLLVGCGSDRGGLPAAPGSYTIKEKSVSFDGEKYQFFWADAAGNLQRAHTDDVKLKLDEKNSLEITDKKEAILHLKQEEPVTVEGRDEKGDFGSFWYPFMIGSMLSRGPVVINNQPPREYRDPVYRYPPTDSFGRGDTIAGNATNTKAKPPDYRGLAPIGGAVSGQNAGAGGGNAATNKANASQATSGQSAGTGSGSAVLNKSGSFKAGEQSFSSKSTKGSTGLPSINTTSKAPSAPSVKVSKPSTGASLPKISIGRRR
ncbi:MAG: hypothetical protein EPO26_16390 [Chloroflexota bacterium]|nr:MAG: hypothetical protein EPO26_16390 [Chloroflexota bacterium]